MNTSPPPVLAVAYMLLCATFLAYFLNPFAIKVVTSSVVAIYIYLQPSIAIARALFFDKNELTMLKAPGGALVLLGVFPVGKKRKLVSCEAKEWVAPIVNN